MNVSAEKNDKVERTYVCRACRNRTPSYAATCIACGAYGTLSHGRDVKQLIPARRSRTLKELKRDKVGEADVERLKSGIVAFDTLLGGGLAVGSVTLLAGEPGVGKSTLALQLCNDASHAPLYICGEETLAQIASRAVRLKIDDSARLMSEAHLDLGIEEAEICESQILIVDSIQAIFSGDEETLGESGSLSQIKECAGVLVGFAKRNDCAVVIVGHITKDGLIAGPETLMHLVDTVLHFSCQDEDSATRILRVIKNRYGASRIACQFEMGEAGLSGALLDTAKSVP